MLQKVPAIAAERRLGAPGARHRIARQSEVAEAPEESAENQFESLTAILSSLPYGQSFSFPSSLSYPHDLNNISRLNHLKVQFRKNSWQLKSYVKLIQELS